MYDGLVYGLEHFGVQVVRYRLDQRIVHAQRWLNSAVRHARKRNPKVPKPTQADVFYQAGVGVLEHALRHQVDAVLVVSAMYFHPDVIVLLKRAGIKVVILFTESPYDTMRELRVARLADGCWTCERSSVKQFLAVCPNSGYLPHGWHPQRHTPAPTAADETMHAHDVVFVGSSFRERIEWFSAIDWTGIDLGLYGAWRNLPSRHPLRQFVQSEEIDNVLAAALYRRAKICLNLHRRSIGHGVKAAFIEHAESLNPRAYELAACGAFALSDDREEVTETFGADVPTFSTPAEASDLIRYWLPRDAERQAVTQRLPALVAESSWVERAARVIGDLQYLLGAAAPGREGVSA